MDHTDVSITWLVNETTSNYYDINYNIMQLVYWYIVTNGAGTPNSSLTTPGYNKTVVTCTTDL